MRFFRPGQRDAAARGASHGPQAQRRQEQLPGQAQHDQGKQAGYGKAAGPIPPAGRWGEGGRKTSVFFRVHGDGIIATMHFPLRPSLRQWALVPDLSAFLEDDRPNPAPGVFAKTVWA